MQNKGFKLIFATLIFFLAVSFVVLVYRTDSSVIGNVIKYAGGSSNPQNRKLIEDYKSIELSFINCLSNECPVKIIHGEDYITQDCYDFCMKQKDSLSIDFINKYNNVDITSLEDDKEFQFFRLEIQYAQECMGEVQNYPEFQSTKAFKKSRHDSCYYKFK